VRASLILGWHFAWALRTPLFCLLTLNSSVQTIYVDFDLSCFVPVNFFMH
jgi:hypothetical protein